VDIFLRNISLAFEGVIANKFRAFLTALGIVFGVAAVIAMMAIGKGAQQSILNQLEAIGTNNILISAISPEDMQEQDESEDDQSEKKKFSPGLGLADLHSLQDIIPTLRQSSPELVVKDRFTYRGTSGQGMCIGVWNDYFQIFNLQIGEGSTFTSFHHEHGAPVCVVGSNIQQKYFQNASPIGKSIKCGKEWLTIIGVLEKKATGSLTSSSQNIQDYNSHIYVPVNTAIQRMSNRSRIDKSDIGRSRGRSGKPKNYHQLDRVVLKVADGDMLRSSADIAKRAILRRHNEVEDITFDIPELLIKQRQSTQQTLNFVLAIIAGISLLVGGIGIMNIMLASVLERIKEIGIRRAVGAGQLDVIYQFLLEATIISLFGGLIGIVLGIVTAHLIAGSAEIETAIDWMSIILSFGVAVGIGLLFGYLPARRAAMHDPVKALRSD
jgi:putative ABC transport system permease protein